MSAPPSRRPALDTGPTSAGPRCTGSCRYTSSLLRLRHAAGDPADFRALWAEACDHDRDAYVRLEGKVRGWQHPSDLGA